MKSMIEKLESLGLPENPDEINGAYVLNSDTASTKKIYKLPKESKASSTLRDKVQHGDHFVYVIVICMTDIVDDTNDLLDTFEELGQSDFYYAVDSDEEEP